MKESSINLETSSEHIKAMEKDVKASVVRHKQNKEYVEAQVLSGRINTPEDVDAETSAHSKVNKDHDSVSTSDLEGPEYMYS